ncbi:hypothetical protein IE53DRAFT_318658 [Violaceomyces palustris]|uniref:Uncharacterized protein n=1 Tax=Violaceomyces palustris TaxID=1673888 RepID=A0ACD0NSL5_9BASI|nr:hypothetical protein IE53DRAFT_318658 [Violaceomyces palustris]
MAASASLGFRTSRKQSLSSATSGYDHSSLNMPLSPSPVPPTTNGASSADGGIASSLVGPGGAALMAGAPLAANSITNKQAVAGSGLYQFCLNLRDRLYCVPSFGENYLDDILSSSSNSPGLNGASDPLASLSGSPRPASGPSQKPKAKNCDPVTQLWQCFRLGAPLCALFNILSPETNLPVNPDANRSNANACKAQVMKFIIALKEKLGWDPDEIFTVTQLYQNDTNGFVQVVRTINRLLDVFEERGLLTEGSRQANVDELEAPVDDRAKVIRELLTTERKYVQDLEVMQNYAKALAQTDILPPDTIHNLFGNLNKLVDVQRRFLICVEENVRRPPDEQHFGHVFRTMEEDFAVYEPFCANYAQALDIINAEAHNIVKLKGLPAAEGCYLEPSYELPTFLIKPVQRICKYPLLLEQLLKKTPEDAPRYQELVDGLEVIRRITDNVNETSRLQENIQIVKDLETRVEDWKGHNIKTFGSLLLSDVFMVAKSDTEREYHVYLFEKILLCCKEVIPATSKKNSKNNALLAKQKAVSGSKKSKNMLQLKGRIFINNVTGAFSSSKMASSQGAPISGSYSLQVWWRGDVDQESFGLKCKNEEQLKQWQAAINKLIDEVNMRRMQAAAQYGQSAGISPGGSMNMNMTGFGANGRRNTATSSHFPQTPLAEVAPVNPFSRLDSMSRTDSQASSHRHDDEEADQDGLNAGRGTPLGARYSQPAEQRDRQTGLNPETRPRARTEDQDSSVMTQWRSHSPAMAPPLPRGLSLGNGSDPQLRKASSSRQLRQPAYAAGAHQGYPRPPRANGIDGNAVEYLDGGSDHPDYRQFPGRPRGDSVASAMSRTGSEQMHTRSRSASNPQMYPLPPHLAGPAPPLPRSGPSGHPELPYATGRAPGGSTADKRFSSSSISTVDSVQSGQSRPQSSTAASSPVTLNGNGNGIPSSNARGGSTHAAGTTTPHPSSNAVKLLVHYGDDRFVVVVLSNISFAGLLEKVTKKVRVCSGKKTLNEGNLRLRYIDEDRDQIMMNDDDDVQMAFEAARSAGQQEVELVVA